MAEPFQDRLSDINTIWADVVKAQQGSGNAQQTLFERYGNAVRRYLLVALGNEAAADDVTQEFGLALVQSKFRQADPERGRFRDYVKGVLFNLLRQYRRRECKQQHASQNARREMLTVNAESEQLFQQNWRDELLARTWAALALAHPDLFTVLHFRAAHPDLATAEMTDELGRQLGKRLSADAARQMLHRARKLFADLLLDEVTRSLVHPTVDAVQEELTELNLQAYFRVARD